MPFDLESIHYIAQLACLNVDHSEDNEHSIQKDLNQIVAMVDQISAANTDGIEPMAHPLDTHQRLREDIITEFNERETLLALAPLEKAGLFLVPTVIE